MSVDLKVAPCSHPSAEYAVMTWHYSKRMPVGKLIKIGAWEDERFIGAVIFARGNTPTLGSAYGLTQLEVCELVRVALCKHESTVSQIASKSIKMLKEISPGLRLIVSFADPAQGHHGGIYQAGNWIYCGESSPAKQWLHEGRWKHNREMTSGAFGGGRKVTNYQNLPSREVPGKHRYLYPLDKAMRRQIEPLAKPYPKRADVGEMESR